jgi:hypothetical protein
LPDLLAATINGGGPVLSGLLLVGLDPTVEIRAVEVNAAALADDDDFAFGG